MDALSCSASAFAIGRNDGDFPLSVTRSREPHDGSTRRVSSALCWLTATIRSARRMALRMVVDQNGCTTRSEEHTSELQSHSDLVCRLLLEKKKKGSGHV